MNNIRLEILLEPVEKLLNLLLLISSLAKQHGMSHGAELGSVGSHRKSREQRIYRPRT